MKPNNRGQAMIEFAVMASIALMALALLIQVGLRMNYQQEIEQQTFRRALRSSAGYDTTDSQGNPVQNRPPQSVTYIHYRDRQIPDPSDGFALMPRMTTEAQSSVVWARFLSFLTGDSESKPRTVVNLNDTIKTFNADDLTGQPSLVSDIDRRIQSSGGIVTTRSGTGLVTTTTDDTTMTLNTKRRDAIQSSLTSQSTFNW